MLTINDIYRQNTERSTKKNYEIHNKITEIKIIRNFKLFILLVD